MLTQFLRRRAVADRYQINLRTLDRWVADGKLPRPSFRGRIPLWNVASLDEYDRRAADQSRGRTKIGALVA